MSPEPSFLGSTAGALLAFLVCGHMVADYVLSAYLHAAGGKSCDMSIR